MLASRPPMRRHKDRCLKAPEPHFMNRVILGLMGLDGISSHRVLQGFMDSSCGFIGLP